jgi:hypothetical protein
MYISVAPNRHPNQHNFTWAQAMFGSDTLTIQSRDLATYCPAGQMHTCDFYIGVYGWRNSSYSIVATVRISLLYAAERISFLSLLLLSSSFFIYF